MSLPAEKPTTPHVRMQRVAVRCFALIIICTMVIDALPYAWMGRNAVRRTLSAGLNRIGLWQGEWSMFAPDPVINNGWLTVELQSASGPTLQWDSPQWAQASGWEKFVRFRHLNFYNRLPQIWNLRATDDFLNYVARQSGEPVDKAKLFKNQLRLRMPSDGTLPQRDEVEWHFSTELWTQRDIQP